MNEEMDISNCARPELQQQVLLTLTSIYQTLFTWSDNAKAEKELTSLERWMLLASHLRK